MLPVYQPGALLFSATATRCRATASRRAPASKPRWRSSSRSSAEEDDLTGPRVETQEHIISTEASLSCQLDQSRIADGDERHGEWLTSSTRWSRGRLSLDRLSGRYDIVTVAGSVALKLAKSQLPTR